METSKLNQTPLYDLHRRLGARMIPFAGYEMPVQYPSGIVKEHLHTRAAAGLFDVSHMGQIELRPRLGTVEQAARALETLVPSDILGLKPGRQRYTLFTNDGGGILDDLMVANRGDHLLLVVNASRKEADTLHLRQNISDSCHIEPLTDRALLTLQGPQAESVLAGLAPEIRTMAFMDIRTVILLGASCIVSRSGYTGEDGFEIGVPANIAVTLFEILLRDPAVAPAGLGARDSLRLEAGLCLYGAELDPATTPVEAALDWTIPRVRRAGGKRAGGFPGSATVMEQLERGAARLRVGLRPEGKALVRGGAALFLAENDLASAGIVTSGGFGVTLNAPVAMGYVPRHAAAAGTRLFAELRGKRVPVIVSGIPFVTTHYKRA